MHTLYVYTHGWVIYLYTGVGEQFSCDPYLCFDLGKLFIQLWGAKDKVNLEMFTKQFAVSDDANK